MKNFRLMGIEARDNCRWQRWMYQPPESLAAEEVFTVSEDGHHSRIVPGQELCWPIWGMWDDDE